jgi:hypothetical protein
MGTKLLLNDNDRLFHNNTPGYFPFTMYHLLQKPEIEDDSTNNKNSTLFDFDTLLAGATTYLSWWFVDSLKIDSDILLI